MGIGEILRKEKVKEYTLLAIASAIAVILLDLLVLRTRILVMKIFWIFLIVMYGFKTLVNGYLTWRPIVLYGEEFTSGVRFFTIPLEDYVYGFSLIALRVVLWEYWKSKRTTVR